MIAIDSLNIYVQVYILNYSEYIMLLSLPISFIIHTSFNDRQGKIIKNNFNSWNEVMQQT